MNSGRASVFFPNAGQQEAPPEPTEKIPLEIALNARDGGEYSASNPITAAAAPLLILLGRLRLMIIDMQAVPLMTHVAQEIRDFEKKAGEAGVAQEDIMVAKYALCGTADDIVQNLPGTDRHVWMQYSMLAQFFQVRTSGVGFFEELKKILANPAPRYDLLELMHACLSLGFEGQYRGAAGGDVQLQNVAPRRLPDAAASPDPQRRRHLAALAGHGQADAQCRRDRAGLGRSPASRARPWSASISCCASSSAPTARRLPRG